LMENQPHTNLIPACERLNFIGATQTIGVASFETTLLTI
jgi:hypothetical protein